MEIRRFGIGHRRREKLPGTHGVSGQPIHSDARGHIAELAFERHASITPHTNPNTTWFVVIEGGGFVLVGDEEVRVAAGEAVLWPANVVHGARTAHSPMRAIVVEFSGDETAPVALLMDGHAAVIGRGPAGGNGSEADVAESHGSDVDGAEDGAAGDGAAEDGAAALHRGEREAQAGEAPDVVRPSGDHSAVGAARSIGSAAIDQRAPIDQRAAINRPASSLRADGRLAPRPAVDQSAHVSPDEEPW